MNSRKGAREYPPGRKALDEPSYGASQVSANALQEKQERYDSVRNAANIAHNSAPQQHAGRKRQKKLFAANLATKLAMSTTSCSVTVASASASQVPTATSKLKSNKRKENKEKKNKRNFPTHPTKQSRLCNTLVSSW